MPTHQRYYAARRFIHPLLFALLCCCLVSGSVWAEVTLDGTFGRSGAVSGPDYRITADLGQQVGPNLFHSFGKFNVNTAESATFSGPASISNIISRVTGGTSSWIDGLLRSEITGANLYLLNPSGVMFGPNASLDISGSFHVSTADYLKLGHDGVFYATTPESRVLTSAPPSAFGFLGSNPMGISLERSVLKAPAGKGISFIGGDMVLHNGSLRAPGGRIDIVSVASPGEVQVTNGPPVLNGFVQQGNVRVLRDVNFTTYADLDVSGSLQDKNGGIYIRGGRFEMQGGSIYANNTGSYDGRGVTIGVTGDVVLSTQGLSNGGLILSRTSGTGKAGDVVVDAKCLELTGGSYIDTRNSSSGPGGNIDISASESTLFSGQLGWNYSGLYSRTDGNGKGGNISVTTPDLTVTEQGKISTKSWYTGRAGDILLNVGRLSITSGGSITADAFDEGQGGRVDITATESVTITGKKEALISKAGTATQYTADGGDVRISTPIVVLDDGASIYADSFGNGNSGNIHLNVGALSLTGGSQVTTGAWGQGQEGQGGDIAINASQSIFIGGSNPNNGYYSGLYTNTTSSGNAGNIRIVTPSLFMEQDGQLSAKTGLGASGNAGEIQLDVGILSIRSGAGIGAESLYGGRGGDIKINATQSINISGKSEAAPSGLFASTLFGGQGGNIALYTPSFFLDQEGKIQSITQGGDNAGHISINVENFVLAGGGSISASTYSGNGNGGDIMINAGNSVQISGYAGDYPSTIGSNSREGATGNAGKIMISAPQVTLSEFGSVQTNTETGGKAGDVSIKAGTLSVASEATILAATMGDGNAGSISLNVDRLDLSSGGAVVASTLGKGQGGSIQVSAYESVTIKGERDGFATGLYAKSKEMAFGDGGSINITAPQVLLDAGGRVSATTLGSGRGGNVWFGTSNLTVTNGALVDTSSSGSGLGGDIRLNTTNLYLLNGGGIASRSTHTGDAGSVAVNALGELRMFQGALTTEAIAADGGNIDLHVGSMVSLVDSDITATVRSGHGNGGNVNIDPVFVVLNDGRITANAYGGRGGNILIVSDYFLATPNSCVQASSQLGISGTVNISAPDVDLSGSLTVLPANYLDATSLLRDRCAALSDEKTSSLVVVGRGGMPIEPDDYLPSP